MPSLRFTGLKPYWVLNNGDNKRMINDWSPMLLKLCQQVGLDMMMTYEQHLKNPMEFERKANNTPLTAADTAAHNALVAGLNSIDGSIAIVSEESSEAELSECKTWSRFWLIDPLDGTKEFIDGTDEFCICIALVESGKPVFGFIYAPVTKVAWWGGVDIAATKYSAGGSELIRCNSAPSNLVASWRGHYRKDVAALVDTMGYAKVTMGSALKFCLIAEGDAQIYPSLGPTSEWDSAAGQALVEAAGGIVVDVNGQSLSYNQGDNFTNPPFYALADISLLPAQ
jgi:3'(2'), 5'-bisphosphate nucleotidase